MQLEAGKKYTDRRGRVYGPMVFCVKNELWGETGDEWGNWFNDGRLLRGVESTGDLVAEYVEPVKAAEPADNRTAPGEGYRLLNVGEYEQEGDEYYNADKSEWVPTGLVGSRCTNADRLNGYSIRRKVEQPAPVESPDDLVIQDRVPARAGIDFGWNVSLKDWDIYKPCETWKWKIDETYTGRMHGSKGNIGRLAVFCRRKDLPPIESPDDWVILDPVVYAEHVPRVGIDQFQGWDNQWTTQESYHSKQPIGLWYDATGGNHTRCRRKDLPPVPPQKPVEPEFPQFIIYATGGTFADCAYIVRTSEDDAYSVLANGKRGVDFKWKAYKTEILKSGVWKRVTEQEAEKLVSRTRTVVLKEWLCWDDDHEDVVLLRWSSANPVVDNGNLSTFDHAVETGNTRTVEIPVT